VRPPEGAQERSIATEAKLQACAGVHGKLLARPHIPEPRPFPVAARDNVPVRVERDGKYLEGLAKPREPAPGFRIPQVNAVLPAPRRQSLPGGVPCEIINDVGMLESQQRLAGGAVHHQTRLSCSL
jgi:hypothetical protein